MLNHKRLTLYKLHQFAVFGEILLSCGRQLEETLPRCGALALVLLRGLCHLLVIKINLHKQIAILDCPFNVKTYRIWILTHKPAILNWKSSDLQLQGTFNWKPCSASMNHIRVSFVMHTFHLMSNTSLQTNSVCVFSNIKKKHCQHQT